MELTVGEGDSVNGIKWLKNDTASYLSELIMYKYPSLCCTFLMHNYEDAPQDRLINKMRGNVKHVCVCVCRCTHVCVPLYIYVFLRGYVADFVCSCCISTMLLWVKYFSK